MMAATERARDGTVLVSGYEVVGDPWLRWAEPGVGFPPRSHSGYRRFHTERLGLGRIVAATLHAPQDFSADEAAAWYRTAPAVGMVHAEDTDRGIELVGHLLPRVDEALLREHGLMAPDETRLLLSGDWRKVNGHLELVALVAIEAGGSP